MDKHQHNQEVFHGAFSADKVKEYWRDQKPNIESGKFFTDPYFPPNKSSLLALDSHGKYLDATDGPKRAEEMDVDDIEWKRASEIFPKHLLFSDKIEFSDIKQGNLGNCYFLSAIAALTEFPQLIYQIFRTKNVTPEGCYEVVLFIDGQWHIVFIDDYFPVKKGTSNFCFAKPNGNELWAILLEKAWAKVNGGYVNVISGWPSDPLAALTGFATQKLTHKDLELEELWEILKISDQNDNIMCTSTKNDENVENFGLVVNHAYTLIGAKETFHNGSKIRLVHIRNPWGYKEWNGNWADGSNLWTPELNEFYGHTDLDDGTFFMSFEDFCSLFECTHVCHVMYDSNIKSYYVETEHVTKPHVFNLFLQESTRFAISLITPHWRYTRTLKWVTHPFSLVIARYDIKTGTFSDVEGEYLAYENLEYVKVLPKGLYVVWVYLAHHQAKDPKPDSYQVRFISPTKYRVRLEHFDEGFEFIRELIIAGVKEKFADKVSSSEQYYGIENSFKRTGIGYRCVINNSTTVYQKWVNDPTKIEKMFMLPPFDNKKNFDLWVPPSGYGICIGMKNDQWGTYWFNLQSSYYNYTCKDGEDPTNTKKVNIPQFVSSEVCLDDIDETYYDYFSSSLKDAKQELQFERMTTKEICMEDLNNSYPELIKHISNLPELFPGSDNSLQWGKLTYDNGFYVGQFNENKIRHGKGVYCWTAQKIYYAGCWLNNQREKWGKLLDGDLNVTYEGGYSKGVKNGTGKMAFTNGDFYEGEFQNDKRIGSGTYIWTDGSKWKGPFVNSQMHGVGTYYPDDGTEPWQVEYRNGQYVE